MILPAVVLAGVKVFDSPDQTLEIGLRLQPRFDYERLSRSAGGAGQRDFLVRRARLKASGKMKSATFNFEWKIDGTDRKDLAKAVPEAQVENAYLQYALGRGVELRAGLYDQPFSRDRLTSDSKQLAVDRGDVSNVPNDLGLADNVVGLQLQVKVSGGRAQYAVGLFDNRFIEGQLQDVPMVVGRLDLNFGSTKDIFQDAHFGSESWYSIGLDGSFQKIDAYAGADSFSNAAGGVDGMIDIPVGSGRLLAKGEMNAIRNERHGGTNQRNATVRMLGVGFLMLNQRLQPFVRFDQVRGDRFAKFEGGGTVGGTKDITFVGANFYQKGHNLKVQGDVKLQAATREILDGARLQAQIDF